jgi:hypothetical protein
MTRRPSAIFSLIILVIVNVAQAQFAPALLQNDSYWGDGKAEFDFYDAQIVRDGQRRGAEIIMSFLRESLDMKTLARVLDPKTGDAAPVIHMNQSFQVIRGLFVEQQSLDIQWRANSAQLAKLIFIATDMGDVVSKIITGDAAPDGYTWDLAFDSSRGGSARLKSKPTNGAPPIFYDELPLRVRSIDFRKPAGEFEISLIPSIANAHKDLLDARPAKVSFKIRERVIDIDVHHDSGADHFVLDRDFPFLLREWQMADGSRLKMKNSLKVDYWNYSKNGDRERALKDPMLRRPD